MPKVILSCKSKKDDSVFLTDWIFRSLHAYLSEQSKTNLWLPIKKFIKSIPEMGGDMLLINEIINDHKRFIRIVRFCRVDNYKIFAIGKDTQCLVLS